MHRVSHTEQQLEFDFALAPGWIPESEMFSDSAYAEDIKAQWSSPEDLINIKALMYRELLDAQYLHEEASHGIRKAIMAVAARLRDLSH